MKDINCTRFIIHLRLKRTSPNNGNNHDSILVSTAQSHLQMYKSTYLFNDFSSTPGDS